MAINTTTTTDTQYNKGGLGGALSYMGQKFLGGLVGFTEGIVDFTVGGLAKVFGNNDLSDYMIKTEWMDYAAADREFNPDSVAKIAGDVISGIGNSAIPMAAAILTGGASTGVQLATTFGLSALSGGGNAVSEAYKETGEINDQTWLYGGLSGALEGAVETGSELVGLGFNKIIKGFKYANADGWIKTSLKSALGETIEEGITATLNPYIKKSTYDENAEGPTLGNVSYSAVVGGLSGFLMGDVGYNIGVARDIYVGKNAYNNDKTRESILSVAKDLIDYEEKEQTGNEYLAGIKETLNKLNTSTNAISQMRQLGVLKQQIGAALLSDNAATAATTVLADPQATVDSINAFYGDHRITVEELTKGLKSTDVNSKDFGKSLYKALRDNDTLRNIVAIQMVGNAELAYRDYAEAILGDTPISTIATQQNINRFVESSDPDTISRVSDALGINMYTATAGDLAAAIARARDGRTLTAYEAGLSAVRAAQGARASLGEIPGNITALIKMKDGASRFSLNGRDVAIIREGSTYRIYDYESKQITKPLTAAEVMQILSEAKNNAGAMGAIADGKTTEDVAKNRTEREKDGSQRVTTEQVKDFCEKNIPEYKKLTPSEREAVRMTVRQALSLEMSEADIAVFGRIAAISGMNIYIRDNIPGENAFYDGRNAIYINAKAERGKTFGQLLGHEMFHKLFKEQKGGMALFKGALKNVPADLKKRVMDKYEKAMKSYVGSEAARAISVEEAAAAYSESVFGAEGVMEYLLSEKPSLKERITDFFTGASKKYAFESQLSSAAQKWLKQYKKLFDRVAEKNKSTASLVNATERYCGKINEQKMQDSGKRSSYSSIAYSFFSDKKVSIEDLENGSYKNTDGYKKYVDDCLNNMRQSVVGFNESSAKREIIKSIDGIVSVAVAMKKAGYDILDNQAQRETKDSKDRLLFSSLEPNSDYFTSSDISTICDKRINFAEIYDEIVRREEEMGVPKNKRFFNNIDNYFVLHKILADKGLTAPCRQCYVESMRKNLDPMANAFIELMQETDPTNKANKQLYQPSGKNKGELKSNNAKLRENLLEVIEREQYDITADKLTIKMLTTAKGLAQLKLQAPLIYEAFNSFYGQSKPKMPKAATPFRFGELTALLTDDKGKIKTGLIKQIKSTGGFRLQSYSDFQIQNFADVLQVIFEAGTLGLNGHAYTKVPAFLDATKDTNLKRNISIFMYNDGGQWKIDRGDSFPYELDRIYDIVDSDKSGNTGIIAVVQNEDMAAWVMANDNIGYFIPFHKSGVKMGVVRETIVREGGREIKGYSGIKDHTRQQTEVWAKTTADHKANTKVSKAINIYEDGLWDFDNSKNLSKKELIEKNVKAYIDACNEAGYLPKFREYVMDNNKVLNKVLSYAKELGFVSQSATIDDISFEYSGYKIPYGYYKCLGDFGMFTPDGEASPIERLSLKGYNFKDAVKFFSDAETLRRNEILQQFENGTEREKYRNSDMTTAELAEEVQNRRNRIVDEIVSVNKPFDKRSSLMESRDLVAYEPQSLELIDESGAEKISADDMVIEIKNARKPADGVTRKERAEFKNKKVYNKAEVSAAVKSIEGINLLTAQERGEIINTLWSDLNAPDSEKAKAGYVKSCARRVAEGIIDALEAKSDFDARNTVNAIARTAFNAVNTLFENGGHESDLTKMNAAKAELKSKIKDQSKTEKNLVELEAQFANEKVYRKTECQKAIKELPVAEKLSAKDINDLADKMWINLNKVVKKKDQAAHLNKMAEIITERIKGIVDITDESAYIKLGVQVEDAVNRVWDLGGERSKKAIIEDKVAEQKKQSDIIQKQLDERDIRYKAFLELDRTVLMLREKKFGTIFDNATEYRGQTLKELFKQISSFDFRRTFSETDFRDKVKRLSEWYNKDNPMLGYTDDDPGWYDQGIKAYLDAVGSANEEVTLGELKAFNDVLKYFIHLAENYDKVWINEKWVDAQPLAEKYVDKIESDSRSDSKVSKIFRNRYAETFESPESVMQAADGFVDGFYTESWRELRAAEVDAEVSIMEILRAPQDFVSAKENRGWIKSLPKKTSEVRGVKLSKLELIEYYMTLHRETMQEVLAVNGFEVRTDDKNYQWIPGFAQGRKLTKPEVRELARQEIARVQEMLDERDMQFIKLLEAGYKICGEMKSEADINRLGIANVEKGYYYPARHRYVKSLNVWDHEAGCVDRFTYASYNRHLKEHALQPLEIGSAWDTFNRHVRGITYYSRVSPVTETFNRLWKFNLSDNKNLPRSIETASEHSKVVWRDKDGNNVGRKYYEDMVYNIRNGSRARGLSGNKVFSALTGSMSVAALGANPKVWFTQFSSLGAATSLLSKTAVAKGMFVKANDVYKYCPIAELRAMDNVAVRAQSVVDKIGKIGEFLTKPIGYFDRVVVKRLFGACQVEVQMKYDLKIGTEENKIKAGELLKKVLLETQQNTFVTTRMNATRNGGELVKNFARFKSDAVQGMGKFIASIGRVSAIKNSLKNKNLSAEQRGSLNAALKKAKKQRRKALEAILITSTMMLLVTELFKWAYNKEPDENKLASLAFDFFGNILGGLPFIADAYDALLSGYGMDSMGLDALNDFINSTRNTLDYFGKVISGERVTGDESHSLLKNISFTLAQVTGIAARNIYNTIYGLIKRHSTVAAYHIDDFFKAQNYKADFKKSAESGDEILAADIIKTAFEVYVGAEIDDNTAAELVRLGKLGYDSAPSDISSSITIDGESVKLTEDEKVLVYGYYKDAAEAVKKLVNSRSYRRMSDEEKEKAIKKVYSSYRSKGYDAVRKERGAEKDTPASRLKKALASLNKKSQSGLKKSLGAGLAKGLG